MKYVQSTKKIMDSLPTQVGSESSTNTCGELPSNPTEGGRIQFVNPFSSTSAFVIHILVGLFLIFTAALKIIGFRSLSVTSGLWLAHPFVQAVALEWELVLGL